MRLWLFLILFALPLSAADEPTSYDWKLQETYDGAYPDSYERLRYEVPILIRQSLIDTSVTTGLRFQESWNHPLIIRFTDETPPGAENALAYVQLLSDGKNVMQVLSVNLAAYARAPFNFDKVFRHELFHAMLNDALGTDAQNVPRWVHEGMAVYAAGQGDQMINAYLSEIEMGDEERFINGLDGPHGGADYVEDFLAFRYIRERHGFNAIPSFVRALVDRHGDVNAAIQDSCGEDPARFEANARAFAIADLKRIKRTLRGAQTGPY